MADELREQIDSLTPPAGCSVTTRDLIEKTRSQLSDTLDKLAIFQRQAMHTSAYASAFAVFSDVVFTQLRRDQYLSKVREPFQRYSTVQLYGTREFAVNFRKSSQLRIH